jgi:hypothetical protein
MFNIHDVRFEVIRVTVKLVSCMNIVYRQIPCLLSSPNVKCLVSGIKGICAQPIQPQREWKNCASRLICTKNCETWLVVYHWSVSMAWHIKGTRLYMGLVQIEHSIAVTNARPRKHSRKTIVPLINLLIRKHLESRKRFSPHPN